MKNKLLTLAAGLALIAMAGKFFAVPLLAQVRAALVQNVDETGRIPYQSFSQNSNCNPTSCDLFFPAVPSSKRLVITHFDAAVLVSNLGGLEYMSLRTDTSNVVSYPEFTVGAQFAGQNTFLSSRAVLYYVDAGDAPLVVLSANQSIAPISVTLSGYLLDCTSGCAAIAH